MRARRPHRTTRAPAASPAPPAAAARGPLTGSMRPRAVPERPAPTHPGACHVPCSTSVAAALHPGPRPALPAPPHTSLRHPAPPALNLPFESSPRQLYASTRPASHHPLPPGHPH
eukprot:167239-Chlamydomonas_euryale.AAC.1